MTTLTANIQPHNARSGIGLGLRKKINHTQNWRQGYAVFTQPFFYARSIFLVCLKNTKNTIKEKMCK